MTYNPTRYFDGRGLGVLLKWSAWCAAVVTIAVIALWLLTGCTTYRWDRPDCAAVDTWDQPPPGCWCADGDYPCYETSRRAGIVDQSASLHIQTPEIGRRDIIGDIGHVTHVDPSERGHPSPDTARWVQAPMDPETAEALACAWLCTTAYRGVRPEACECR